MKYSRSLIKRVGIVCRLIFFISFSNLQKARNCYKFVNVSYSTLVDGHELFFFFLYQWWLIFNEELSGNNYLNDAVSAMNPIP